MQTIFPNPLEQVRDDLGGLVAISSHLSPEWVVCAYQKGIFPWEKMGDYFLWYCPPQRLILNPKALHFSKSFFKTVRHKNWQIRWDFDFLSVIENCALREKTWIHHEFIQTYTALFAQNWAHAVGVYENEELIGGLYGVQLGKLFCGESMFFKQAEAAKFALWQLCLHAEDCHIDMIDCQVPSPHFIKWGAQVVLRDVFLEQLPIWLGKALPQKWPFPR